VAFRTGSANATYLQSGLTGLAETKLGTGRVLSFGFQYGYAYSRCTMPIVPPQHGKREMHPVVLLKETPVAALLGASPAAPLPPRRGVEMARFGSAAVIVNHRASPLDVGPLAARRVISQVPSALGWLAAHSAALVEL
jgi:hypothetical protein